MIGTALQKKDILFFQTEQKQYKKDLFTFSVQLPAKKTMQKLFYFVSKQEFVILPDLHFR